MGKRSPWFYILFGIYPISLYDLANSNLSPLIQILILSVVASLLVIAASSFQVLNLLSLFSILLFVFTPYIMGKRMR